jgi:hypothetical protein
LILFPSFDRPGPRGANACNRRLVIAGFAQQSGRHHAGAPDAAIEAGPEVLADRRPFRLELHLRRAHIGEGQVQPFRPAVLDFRERAS